MESHGERVTLGHWGEATLDLKALTQFSGQGRGESVMFWSRAALGYRGQLKSWSEKINWSVYDKLGISLLQTLNLVKRKLDLISNPH